MPTYNYADRIDGAVSSVLAQNRSDWELLVVDDASTDGTAQRVRRHHDPRVHVLSQTRHTGQPGPSRNVGVTCARGQLVAYLDQDDRWAPEHLERLWDRFVDPEVALVATGCRRVDVDGGVVGATTPVNGAWHPQLQVLSPIFEPSRVAHRRPVVLAAGGWTAPTQGLEDWDLWLRLSDCGETFRLVADRTVDCTLAPHSRRHHIGHRYLATFGSPLPRSTAQRVLDELRAPDLRAMLNVRYRDDLRAWYRSLAASGRLSLLPGLSATDLVDLIDEDATHHTFTPHIRPVDGDRVVLCRVLACCDQSHAARIVAINQRRTPRSTRLLAHIIDQIADRNTEGSVA